ncbi:MAG: thiamine diphosphokinase [Turicibacter sp.]|nr:thiamine diphosphokinase [Turicibacter sp.]
MRAAIVSGAPGTHLDPRDFLGEDLLVIGADRGALTLLQHGISPHFAVGDFDSVTPEEFERIKQSGAAMDAVASEKDETDTELALNLAIEKKATDILLYGGLGGRMDHSIANIWLMLRYVKKGVPVTLLERNNHLSVLAPGTYEIRSSGCQYLSFFSIGEDVAGLGLEGVKYPLKDYFLAQDDPLCTSNEILSETFTVSFDSGYLLAIQSSDP